MTSRRTVSVPSAIALGIGSMVGAGIFALMGEAAALAGSAVWLSFLGAGVITILTGYSWRSTSTRSTRVARRAGTRHASVPVAISVSAMPA